MFGESESESPRVPSPWDNLISSPPSPSPRHSPSPLSIELELIPRLVPEADDGNVEYKLQLLDPSPARFARLVTQMKWRLLEGGGQAYYELGVADSGDLIGLPRAELERSLETLEMMAGEIGASVIVVKEIEVPAVMATLARRSGEWAGGGGRRAARRALEDGDSTATETEAEAVSTTSGDDVDDLSLTVVLERDAPGVFIMDSESEESAADDERLVVPSRFSIDLEISSVFKPRPVRTRIHNHAHLEHPAGGKTKRVKKHKHLNMLNSAKAAPKNDGPPAGEESEKAQLRRQGRDRRRDEKRKALEARATQAVEPDSRLASQESVPAVADATKQATTTVAEEIVALDGAVDDTAVDDDDDVFASPTTAIPSFPTFSALTTGESHLDVDAAVIGMVGALMVHKEGEEVEQPRLIVEALVVRKISLEEAFLDFGGFSLT
ncbi:hypothetical protein HYPSUDRAFT_1009056 [Hypholoma sublateritium FD-334 SS-4]|uniref:Uncharacterized protein n=1 Tax=Hypholoma sublateritium (strain FD-334 SS-4) TaxID=945553 RepID=A0A0D2M3G4_HYPSF|nr:hypothetical protein HYPSUDRAFT_1009056 [Hypholoma sublateritium FD-334 SS-4]